ncbi:MAG: hypothetical protein KatS3mg131_0836 [Candidatus Tectimicrobiota bacterium]|nr:MAG: hypothetical protein KatS3mg131_0836 [Candidatus Tectomicrobia bacterium]
MACPEPGCSGHIVPRRTRRGRVFYGCTNYPACTFSTWQRPVPRPCPQCQAPYLLEKTNRGQHLTLVCATKGCTYRETAEAASIA